MHEDVRLTLLKHVIDLHNGMILYVFEILTLSYIIILTSTRGVCRISQGGGGPTLKFLGFWIYKRSCELLLGGFEGMSPKKIFKNGAISCVLRAIFNHFHGKKSSQKIINKHEFFH